MIWAANKYHCIPPSELRYHLPDPTHELVRFYPRSICACKLKGAEPMRTQQIGLLPLPNKRYSEQRKKMGGDVCNCLIRSIRRLAMQISVEWQCNYGDRGIPLIINRDILHLELRIK
jgi:hypothetical protein